MRIYKNIILVLLACLLLKTGNVFAAYPGECQQLQVACQTPSVSTGYNYVSDAFTYTIDPAGIQFINRTNRPVYNIERCSAALYYKDETGWHWKLAVGSSWFAVGQDVTGGDYRINLLPYLSNDANVPPTGSCPTDCDPETEDEINNQCYPKCATGEVRKTDLTCVACPSGRLDFTPEQNCVPYCLHGLYDTPPGYYGDEQQCVSPPCGSGEIIIPPENYCKINCPDGQAFWPLTGSCDPPCLPSQLRDPVTRLCMANPDFKCATDEIKTITGLCVKKLICKQDEIVKDGQCVPIDEPCAPGNVRLLTTKECVPYDPPELVEPCPVNEMRVNGECVSVFGPAGQPDCPVGYHLVNGSCINPDAGYHAPDDDGITDATRDRCPESQILVAGKCSGGGLADTSPCPPGSFEDAGKCSDLGQLASGGVGSGADGFIPSYNDTGMGEPRSMQESYSSAIEQIKQNPIFSMGEDLTDIPEGSAVQTVDLGNLGGTISFDWSLFDSIWLAIRVALLGLTSWGCLKIVLLKGGGA